MNALEIDIDANIRKRGINVFKPKVDGVLHPKLLGDVVIFDYRYGTRDISISDRFDGGDQFYAYDMEYIEQHGFYIITVPFHVVGSRVAYRSNARFIVDIAARSSIVLNRANKNVANYVEILDKLHVDDDRVHAPNMDVVVLESYKTKVDDFVLKEINHIVCYKPKKEYPAHLLYDGILGASFFRLFVVVFDFKNNKLYLQPHSENIVVESDV